ncbi:MAG: type II toxin-antitoxin system VapC family toxin [Chloroflexi bacterium]|nr:type II toxin-antitoxin system VapC family toxin [Chloroflexota bacterium]MBU1661394.1 type II toxin-antitoxin system VapC family toxin [Chloroflexota bacterium]
MNGKYLLDTSIIVELFAEDEVVIEQLRKTESTFIPCIAIGELYYGARKSTRQTENLKQVERLVVTGVVLPCDGETGYWYGIVKDKLRRIGKPIPENDIWIAALALQHELILATRDKHFEVVDGLETALW